MGFREWDRTVLNERLERNLSKYLYEPATRKTMDAISADVRSLVNDLLRSGDVPVRAESWEIASSFNPHDCSVDVVAWDPVVGETAFSAKISC